MDRREARRLAGTAAESVREHGILSVPKPKQKKSPAFTQGSRSMYDKPCPTCYAPMFKAKNKAGWACATHGEPTKP